MKFFFTLLTHLFFISSIGQSKVEINWAENPEKLKNINLVGELGDKVIISYINKDKKVAIRKFSDDLKEFEDAILEIPILDKETFYQKSMILDNKLIHFVSIPNKKENEIELVAHVQKDLNSNEFEKFIVANNVLGKDNKWAKKFEYFSEFDVMTSDDKSKILVQPKDYSNDLIFRMNTKTMNVYESRDLSKKINYYNYAPERSYFRNNGIKVSNEGDIFKSDIFKLKNLITKEKTDDIVRVLHCKSDKVSESIHHKSTSSPTISLEFLKFKNDFYVGAIKQNKEKKTFQLSTEIYETNNLIIRDSIQIELDDLKLPFKLHDCTILSMNIDSKSNIIYTLRSSEFGGGYLNFYNIFIISIDKQKQFKFLDAFPIKATIQDKFSDVSFTNKTLNINFFDDQLSLLFRDFTINDKAITYDDYRKFDKDNELESIFMINFNSNGFVNKIKIIEDEIMKKNINHKLVKFIGNKKMLIHESKEDKIGLIKISK